jgi:UDP-3-O-[3-hydroxymyristoyl] glucosamine N-acyltransferase
MLQKRHPGIPLKKLAQAVEGRLEGSGETIVTGVAGLEEAQTGDLVFVANPKMHAVARSSKASALLVAEVLPDESRPQILTPNPLYAFARIVREFFIPTPPPKGIAQDVIRGADVQIGPDGSIHPFVTLGDRVKIGARVTLYPGVFLGDGTVIGDDSILYPHVTVLEGCTVGARVILHSGTVIGSDGFGYVQHQGRHYKIPQMGTVVIEDDVELGANVTVDRATLGQTIIKRGTKIDNQVQIAHNVQVGENCILVAQVGIAGSTTIGKSVMIGGQAGLIDHLTVGDGAKIAAGSGLSHNLMPGQIVIGRPAIDHITWLKSQALTPKLPEFRNQLRELQTRVEELEKHLAPPRRPPKKNS